ncbi:heparan-alpha-glucosaminide N-acetyltransferase domain-containing protein [Rubinisphaera margarita]|uniref:heparan-alpha-glucosaminide N-acetyltransferase domain-containing protein n=1 Tax=Rubinisphaera margarita TaxID=2909586 RepID=UPI001EE8B411|nr:heparan-alpha-glucosaminide N-acetyltransferase domain-containing protein [Rubinisphaera margarita]MCG6157288.1 heparan-alpha-glucosaminide N-acetyltransferase domain-containing protein [Rubinisphaera margarita]
MSEPETYRLAGRNPMTEAEEIAPALQRRSTRRDASADQADVFPASPMLDLKHWQALDLYRGILLLAIVIGLAFLASIERALDQGVTAKEIEANLPGYARMIFNIQPSEWRSLYGSGVIRVRDFLLSGFLFAAGISQFCWRKRRARMEWKAISMFARVLWRTLVLVAMGIFLQSIGSTSTRWVFTDPLSLIGLAGLATFLLARGPVWWQLLIMVGLLFGQYAWFEFSAPVQYPPELQPALVDEDAAPDLREDRWAFQRNIADRWDRGLLSQFPGQPDVRYREAGRTTFNMIPATVLMMIGSLCGWLLFLPNFKPLTRTVCFAIAGGGLVLAGVGADQWICPAIERLLSPSWILIAGGYSLILFAACHLLCDVLPAGGLFYPIRAVGRNSLVMFLAALLATNWVGAELMKHAGSIVELATNGRWTVAQGPLAWMACSLLAALCLAWLLDARRCLIRV